MSGCNKVFGQAENAVLFGVCPNEFQVFVAKCPFGTNNLKICTCCITAETHFLFK